MTTRFGLLVPHFGVEADQDLLIEGANDEGGIDNITAVAVYIEEA